MKEFTIEEKAQRCDGNYKTYIELINRLEDVKDAIKKQNYGIAMDILCKSYPEFQITTSTELEESEDEKIRKWIITQLELKSDVNNPHDLELMILKSIAWLEKQGKIVEEYEDKLDRCACESFNKGYKAAIEHQKEKQGEQKCVIDEGKSEIDYCFTKMMNDEKVSPTWSEEDERMMKSLTFLFDNISQNIKRDFCVISDVERDNYENWLKSLKDRVQPKQEWRGEDIEMLNSAISFVEHSAFTTIGKGKNNVISWLKSLKPQPHWKPTKEQMEYLYKYAEQNNYDGAILTTLYNDLKQL